MAERIIKWTYKGPVGYKMYGEKVDESVNNTISDSIEVCVTCNEEDPMDRVIRYIKTAINDQLDAKDRVKFTNRLVIDEFRLKRIRLASCIRYYSFHGNIPIVIKEKSTNSSDAPIYTIVNNPSKKYVIKATVNDGSLPDNEARKLVFNKFANTVGSNMVFAYCQSIGSNSYSEYHACFEYSNLMELWGNNIKYYMSRANVGEYEKIELEV